jgi:hypothetical protein
VSQYYVSTYAYSDQIIVVAELVAESGIDIDRELT